jgi:hypothetical protein
LLYTRVVAREIDRHPLSFDPSRVAFYVLADNRR